MVADPDEGLFSILKLCRMFRIFRIAKVSSPGLLNRHFQFKPFPLPVYFRLPIMINMTAKSPDRHNENLRIMIRSILASTGELCFMLTLLRTRDLRATNIICLAPLVRFFPYMECRICRSLISSLSIIIFSSGSFLIGSLADTCHWRIWNSSKLHILLRTEQIILNLSPSQQLSGGAVSHWPLLVMVTSFLRHRLEKVSLICHLPIY